MLFRRPLSIAAALTLAAASLWADPIRIHHRQAPRPRGHFSSVNDTWNGGTGNWSNAANWSAGVPNNGVNTFEVFIAGANNAASAVTLDQSATINDLTLNHANDSLTISDNHALTIANTSISNAGNITLSSAGNFTELVIGGSSVTLSGGGTLTMGNNGNNLIFGSVATNLLTNQETIQGSGNIGDNSMALSNSGTINANQSVALTIQTNHGTTNTGTLEATNGATLVLLGDTYSNNGGTIKASGAGSNVALQNSVTV